MNEIKPRVGQIPFEIGSCRYVLYSQTCVSGHLY